MRTPIELSRPEEVFKQDRVIILVKELMRIARSIKEDKKNEAEYKKAFKEVFDDYKEDSLDLLYANGNDLIFNLYNTIFCVARFYAGDKDLLKDEVIHVKK